MGKGGKHVAIWGKLSRQREGQVKSPLKKSIFDMFRNSNERQSGEKKSKR